MAKLCVMYVGGNIGRWRSPDGRLHASGSLEDLFRTLPSGAFRAFDIDFVPLMEKAGESMNGHDWAVITRAIYERIGDYAGFVVLHDIVYMDFSAAAVAFALGPNLNCPIVFTGAQTLSEIFHGDAVVNFLRACVVAETDLAEVVVAVGDHVFRASGVEQREVRRFNPFTSPLLPPLADITQEVLLAPFAFRRREHAQPICLRAEFSTNVLSIVLSPGTEPDLWLPVLESGNCDGIILESLGLGTVADEGSFSFIGFIRRAVELQKPLVVVARFPVRDTLGFHYATSTAALRAGAIFNPGMTPVCAIVKFQWALAIVRQMIAEGECVPGDRIAKTRQIMETPYIGEIGPLTA